MRSRRPLIGLAAAIAAVAFAASPLRGWTQVPAPRQEAPKASPEVESILEAARSAASAQPPRSEEANTLAVKALDLARTLGDRRGEVDAIRIKGGAQLLLNKPEAALALYTESQRLAESYGDRYGQAMALLRMGSLQQSQSRDNEARDLYARSVELLGNSNIPSGSWLRTTIADIDCNLCVRAVQKRALEEAVAAYNQARRSVDNLMPVDWAQHIKLEVLWTRVLELQGRCQEADSAYCALEAKFDGKAKLGSAAHNLFNSAYDLANSGYKARAARIYESVVRLFEKAGDQGKWDVALNNLANTYIDIGRPRDGLAAHRKLYAARFVRGDRSGSVYSLTNIAFACGKLQQYEEAAEVSRQALAISRDLKDKYLEALSLCQLGWAELRLQHVREARENLTAALSLAKGRYTETQAGDLAGLSEVEIRSGDPLAALADLFEALDLHRARGARLDEAVAMRSIGSVYRDFGRRRTAESYYLSSLHTCIETQNRPDEAKARAHLGLLYLSMGQHAKALAQHERALRLARAVGDRSTEAAEIGNIGLCYQAAGQLSKALTQFDAARGLSRQIGDKNFEAIQTHNAGTIFERRGMNARALEYCRRAFSLAAEAQSASESASALADIALMERLLGRRADSARHFGEAAQMVERLIGNVEPSYGARMALQAGYQPIYSGCVDSLLAVGKTSEAFEWAQRMKGRGLLGLLANGGKQAGATFTPAERTEVDRQQGNEARLNLRMVAEGVINKPGSKKRYAQLKSELRAAEDRFQAYQVGLSARHPNLADKRELTATATLADVARFLPDDTVILEYVKLRGAEAVERVKLNHTVLFAVSRSGSSIQVKSYKIRASNSELDRLCTAFHAACSDPRKPYQQLARRLYDLLIRPAAAQLSDRATVVICPDGPLWNVPFQALNDGKRLLSERFALSCSFSATGVLAERRLSANRRRPDRDTLIAFANPAFGNVQRFGNDPSFPGQRPIDSPSRPIDSASRPIDSASRPIDLASRSPGALFTTVLPRGAAIRPLPGTQREADTIARLFPDAKIYTGAEAQEQTAKTEIGEYRYLHFATHGFVNDGAPLLSSLVLATPEDDREDGFLTARELSGLKLSADLAVLSACNTARGEIKEGEGVLGLAWALTVAGCPTQVVSQWAVDDQSTAMLMGRFYENLKLRSMGKAAALKEGQGWLQKQDPKYRHPYYWAPFVLNGAWK